MAVNPLMPFRFGSGLTLQVKVRLNPPPEEAALMRTSSKRFSFRHGIRSRSETPTPVAGGVVIDKYVISTCTSLMYLHYASKTEDLINERKSIFVCF